VVAGFYVKGGKRKVGGELFKINKRHFAGNFLGLEYVRAARVGFMLKEKVAQLSASTAFRPSIFGLATKRLTSTLNDIISIYNYKTECLFVCIFCMQIYSFTPILMKFCTLDLQNKKKITVYFNFTKTTLNL
jgi:hypothetical protein